MDDRFAEEDIDTKKKKVVTDTRQNIDAVEELMTIINPKLKRALDASKNQVRPDSRPTPRKQ